MKLMFRLALGNARHRWESGFGSTSIPIIYERGNGVINLPKMKSGAGTIINVPSGAYEYYQGDK